LKKSLTLIIVAMVAGILLVTGSCSNEEYDRSVVETPVAKEPLATGTDGLQPGASSGPVEGSADTERIVLGGGCFWCVEATLQMVEGVTEVVSGYAGGRTANPGYEEVCTGDTGHAEVVSVLYDPGTVPLEYLLDVFFASHDPTTLNRQGNDVGTQYRSVILYESEDHARRVESYIETLGKEYGGPITTETGRLETFYPAERYHQDYYEENPDQPYSRAVIEPKVEKVKEMLGIP